MKKLSTKQAVRAVRKSRAKPKVPKVSEEAAAAPARRKKAVPAPAVAEPAVLAPAVPEPVVAEPVVAGGQSVTFVANTATVAKASTAAGSTLSADEKVTVKADSTLAGTLLGEAGGHYEIGDAVLDGTPLPANIRFLARGHWVKK